MTSRTVADAIAEWLDEKCIRHAFGIIGAGNLSLWEAIEKKGATQIISVHHEQAAAMAAGFYERTSGRIAVCLVTTGAGSSNAITGVMAAYMDSTPLLILSGNETAASLEGKTRTLGVQGYQSARLADCDTKYPSSGFTKYARSVRANDAIQKLDTALHFATEPRQGPVWIDLPRDVANETI